MSVRRVVQLLGFTVFLAAGTSLSARAADYTVDAVPAQATAADPLAARDAALTKGQRDALNQLFARLASPGQAVPQATDQMVFKALRGFEVQQEKTTATSYSAILSVTFRQSTVDSMLSDSGVAYNAPAQRPAVVVPLLVGADGQATLWTGDNPWAAAWGRRAPGGVELLPLTVPQGDLADLQAVNADAAAAMDAGALGALARNYNADTVIVATAKANGAGYDVSANWLDRGPVYQGSIPSGEAAAFDGAVTATAAAIEAAYAKASAVPATPPQSLGTTVLFSGLADWRRVRQGLEATPAVTSAVVNRLTIGKALVTVNYQGDAGSLAAALAARGVSLTMGADGWVMGLTGTVPGAGLTAAPAAYGTGAATTPLP